MMFLKSLFLSSVALILFCCQAPATDPADESGPRVRQYCIGTYNVENLFDATDDAGIDDSEFTPEGKNRWTQEKYEKKLSNVAKVITSMNDNRGPDLLGLCEVENRRTMNDLVSRPAMKKLNYAFLHHESPDTRGIDVCLLYRKNSFNVLGYKMLPVNISAYDDKPTRDIMMVKGILEKKDTIHLFINHWPSRRGGTKESAPKRAAAARVLRAAVDSLLRIQPTAKLILMGDFNDNPSDASVSEILLAKNKPDAVANSLYNTATIFKWKEGQGSEFYRGDWSRFMQLIVSSSLIKNQLTDDGAFTDVFIYKPDWLLAPEPAYQQMIPRRTFENGSEEIGYSDHLPVYLLLKTD